jgi:diadenosine tetraphosphatase ApaH/serine/threonine PP2A family protein phosphatase
MATIIENKIFVVHGGLFNRPVTLTELDAVDRFHEIPPAMSLLEQMLWNDPDPAPGVSPSSRGGNALYFGPDVVDTFLKQNKLTTIIRSHECVPQGWESMFDGKLYTGKSTQVKLLGAAVRCVCVSPLTVISWLRLRMCAVFSASNYTGSVHNDGAYIVFQKDLVPHPVLTPPHALPAAVMDSLLTLCCCAGGMCHFSCLRHIFGCCIVLWGSLSCV